MIICLIMDASPQLPRHIALGLTRNIKSLNKTNQSINQLLLTLLSLFYFTLIMKFIKANHTKLRYHVMLYLLYETSTT